MSDWEIDNEPSNQEKSEWELDNTLPQQEGFFKKLPKYIGTGLVHAGRNLANYPREIANQLQSVGNQITAPIEKGLGPNPFKQQNPLSNYLPHDVTNYRNVFGLQGQPGFAENAIEKLFEKSPELYMGGKAIKDMLPYLTKRGATKTLKQAQNLAKERGLGETSQFTMTPELIEDARQFFPNTLKNRELFEKAKMGDYDSIFKLQSELGQLSGKRAKSWFNPESKITGQAGLETRGNILDELHNNLRAAGHEDISDLLKLGQQEFKNYMKFKPYRNALIGAGLGYLLPKNALINIGKEYLKTKTQ